ncbi:MAG: glycoside hydrolase family 1 protein [Myxococcales bacterium]|nr:glycoside hydrolase family 1 protein [Myxococcales bacterium]
MRKWPFVVGGIGLLGALAFLPWFGARRTRGLHSVMPAPPPYVFPRDFLFGAATAGHQIERAQPSDWTAFEQEVMRTGRFGTLGTGRPKPGHIHDLGRWPDEVRRAKTNHDALYAQDLALAAQMGHNAYRFSLEWARLFPKEQMEEADPQGVAYYHGLLDAMERAGLTPSATLFHFASPQWLWQERGGRRGWERDDALRHFERYLRAVAKHFGGRISHYCTLNEPMVYVYNGYLEGVFPPGERRGDPSQVAGVVAQLLRAHALAYRILKEDASRRGRSIAVGFTQHTRAFHPYRNWAPLDRLTASLIEQAFIWDFVDAVHTGTLRMTGTQQRQEIPGLKGTQDYLGINYYGRFYVKTSILHPLRFEILMHDPDDPSEPRSDLGWAEYPRGLLEVLAEAQRRYQLPLYVLENGVADAADDDRRRQRYLVAHLRELWLARQRGIDVRGYFHWSLIDNFEWAEGFGPRFGLIRVDYQDGFRRVPRPSADLYRRIIRTGITHEMLQAVGLASDR